MQKGMDKKGQEGVTLTTLLLIVLGAVVVVIVILGFTKGFDFIFGNVGNLPGQQLEVVVQSCQVAAGNELSTDYCTQLKKVELNGQEQYVTCNELEKQNYLGDVTLNCGDLGLDETEIQEYCKNKKLKDGTLVNSVACLAEVVPKTP